MKVKGNERGGWKEEGKMKGGKRKNDVVGGRRSKKVKRMDRHSN